MLFVSLVWSLAATLVVAREAPLAVRTANSATGSAATPTTPAVASGTEVVVDNSTTSINYSALGTELSALASGLKITAIASSATQTLAISIPSSLQVEIMTAVPAAVIVSLMNPAYRSSMASSFKAGNTPSWYEALPADLKTFFNSMAGAIATGDAVYTVSSTPTSTATGNGNSNGDNVPTTSSSSAMAAQPTGSISNGMMVEIMALAGVLGLALAL